MIRIDFRPLNNCLIHSTLLKWLLANVYIILDSTLSERQLEKRKTICELLLERCERKSVLHGIVTDDGKWVYYENPKRQKAWVLPGEPNLSTPKRNIHVQKLMLCIWCDQESMVYHESLKPDERIRTVRYKQQLIKLNQSLKKAPRVRQTSWQTDFTPWQCSSTRSRTSQNIWNQLGNLTSPTIFTWHSAIWLSLASSHWEWFVITACQVFWRYRKMDQWIDRLKKQGYELLKKAQIFE